LQNSHSVCDKRVANRGALGAWRSVAFVTETSAKKHISCIFLSQLFGQTEDEAGSRRSGRRPPRRGGLAVRFAHPCKLRLFFCIQILKYLGGCNTLAFLQTTCLGCTRPTIEACYDASSLCMTREHVRLTSHKFNSIVQNERLPGRCRNTQNNTGCPMKPLSQVRC